MAEFTTIPKSQAPRQPAKNNPAARRMAEYESYVLALKPGSAGKLIPGKGETPFAVMMRVRRAGRRLSKPVDAWRDDGVVYFRGV